MARGVIARGATREDQAALALVNHLVAVTVATIVERDPSLASYIGTLIVRLADQIGHLFHTHSDLQLCELAARRWLAGNFAFPAVDALDCLCIPLGDSSFALGAALTALPDFCVVWQPVSRKVATIAAATNAYRFVIMDQSPSLN